MNYERWAAWLVLAPIMFSCLIAVVFVGAFGYAVVAGSNEVALQIVEVGVSVSILSMITSFITVQLFL